MNIKPPILSKPLQTYSVNSSMYMHMGLQVRRKEKSMKMYFKLEVVERLKENKTESGLMSDAKRKYCSSKAKIGLTRSANAGTKSLELMSQF